MMLKKNLNLFYFKMLICTLQMNCRLPICSYTSTHLLHKDPDCFKVCIALQKRHLKAPGDLNFHDL